MDKSSLNVAYPFMFHKEEDGGYFIESVDLQGVYTGVNEEDIAYGMELAKEVLGMTLADLIENSMDIPKASDIKNLKCNDGFVTMINVDVSDYIRDNAMVKKTLSIPKWANDTGKRFGINFSKLLTDEISKIAMKGL